MVDGLDALPLVLEAELLVAPLLARLLIFPIAVIDANKSSANALGSPGSTEGRSPSAPSTIPIRAVGVRYVSSMRLI